MPKLFKDSAYFDVISTKTSEKQRQISATLGSPNPNTATPSIQSPFGHIQKSILTTGGTEKTEFKAMI